MITDIFNHRYTPAMRWSERNKNGSGFNNLVTNIRSILQLLSGNEIINLLKDVIRKNEMKEIAEKYYKGLIGLSIPINKVKPKNKHFFIHQLKVANFSLNEIKEMNFKCSKFLWSSCKRTNERLEGGQPRISDKNISAINSIMEKYSTISSWKSIQIRKRPCKAAVSKFEPRKMFLKLNNKKDTVISNENVRFCTIAIQEAKEEYDKQIAANLNTGDPYHYQHFTITKQKNSKSHIT